MYIAKGMCPLQVTCYFLSVYYLYWCVAAKFGLDGCICQKLYVIDVVHVRNSLCRVDGNYTRVLRAVLNKSWRQHPTKRQLHGHLPPITKTIQIRQTRHAGHCWRSKGELISDVLLGNPSNGQTSVGRPARTYLQPLSADTGCSLEDLQGAIDDRDGWRESVREIRAS